MRVTLQRLETSDEGTFGKIQAQGLTLFTGELPWRDNAANISCIPEGIYQCVWALSPHFKRFMYGISSVRSRTGVRIHSANFMGFNPPYRKQLNGCIALGEKLGWIDKQKAVLLSAPAVRKFEMLMDKKPFELEIKNG